MKLFPEKYFIYIVIALALTRFWGIRQDEIQPWDEGLYASRIKACVEKDMWLDQTELAPGGLYSSAHPPLAIWSNAVFAGIFGQHEFAYRIATAAFGALLIIMIYLTPMRKLKGLIAAAIIATSSFIFYYSGHSQLDIPLAFFIILGAFFWRRFEKYRDDKYLWLTGIAFGLGLWTKIIVAVILPVSIGTYLLFLYFKKQRELKEIIYQTAVITLTGIVIILPWIIFMYARHGADFLDHFLLFHLFERSLQGVEGNVKSLGIFYYINQIAVIVPLTVAMLFINPTRAFKDRRNWLFLFAFGIPFLIFTIAKTKLAAYMIPILPFIALAAANNISREDDLHSRFRPWQALLIILLQLWSYFPELRNKIKDIIRLNFPETDFTLVIIAATISIALFIFYFRAKIMYVLPALIAIQAATAIYGINAKPVFNGIKPAAEYYYTNDLDELIYIRPPHDSKADNPQISFYFNWINLKNKSGEGYHLLTNYPEKPLPETSRGAMIIIEKGKFDTIESLDSAKWKKIVDEFKYKAFVRKE